MQNVLILGCGRSGTSILGEFFEKAPGYRYLYQPRLVPGTYAAALGESPGAIAVNRPRVARESHESQLTPGLPFHWPTLWDAFPSPKVVIWIVRHPFDAVCSLRPGISSDWDHSPRPENWRSLQSAPWEEQCAHHWVNINLWGYDAVKSVARVLRYEDMVADPANSARTLISWIGLPEGAHARETETWITSVGNRKAPSVYEARFQDRWSELNHQFRVGRHRENLDDSQRELIRKLVEPVARKFGYDLSAR